MRLDRPDAQEPRCFLRLSASATAPGTFLLLQAERLLVLHEAQGAILVHSQSLRFALGTVAFSLDLLKDVEYWRAERACYEAMQAYPRPEQAAGGGPAAGRAPAPPQARVVPAQLQLPPRTGAAAAAAAAARAADPFARARALLAQFCFNWSAGSTPVGPRALAEALLVVDRAAQLGQQQQQQQQAAEQQVPGPAGAESEAGGDGAAPAQGQAGDAAPDLPADAAERLCGELQAFHKVASDEAQEALRSLVLASGPGGEQVRAAV